MILYVEEKVSGQKTGRKIILDIKAPTRAELRDSVGSNYITIGSERYHIEQVKAMSTANSMKTGMLLGAVLGMLGGAATSAAGGLLGAAIGRSNDNQDEENTQRFNGSKL